ncbi:hypothetical protein GOBAR_AA36545 [Gossypium barbadense]|uniref:60S acidic ribosomal protein P3 n=1 Tax=Gossypium barbadense TaxID=3634 RepID=A0A2P5VZB1_GOSBA|nr:hypothetical protein GOBAR_AA36545 [Gossypium barbadense]
MGVFTFVCRSKGGEWSAKQLEGEIESSAASTYELQRKLVQAATACDSSGGVTSSFSVVTPNSAVFQIEKTFKKCRIISFFDIGMFLRLPCPIVRFSINVGLWSSHQHFCDSQG